MSETMDAAIDVAELLSQQLGGDSETGTITPDPVTATEPSTETQARERGWKPKEEFAGDPALWVDPAEFMRRTPLIERSRQQNRKIKELERTVEAMSKHYSMSIKQAKEQAIKELSAQRVEAIELGEVKRVEAIETQIRNVVNMAEPPVAAPPIVDEIEDFISKNKDWYNKDEEMTLKAQAIQDAYYRKNPNDLQGSLDKTLEDMKKLYPEKFTNQRRYAAPPVESGGKVQSSGSKYSVNRLTHEQKLVYNQLVRTHKEMSHDEYFKGLEEAGFLGV